ncbi:MarR family transcriptional regulator [Azospirillum sp. RWY-5-1]|uniref:MarR family transcriptional regulator n=1 Tax=Azospirillum oleiclasticum TaxID=2735135 RepID=A0ABX2TAY7_9PROT|nr:helix-turn-helix domain-containing GNAT family N-acetyltransferase [Azospirillum oleiclasticum]NYZ15233.1 MarR family transcriptional regulator [Azospirillum oleiclasticum]NYZ21346.1 MarR family transcriptional regulator [Azospirillum oleiclasticum]
MRDTERDESIAAVRSFNRFYTRRIGVLRDGLLNSDFSLTEARVLYELAHAEGVTAAGIARELGLDPGYLSRILRTFERGGMVSRMPSPSDARQSILALTTEGRKAYAALDARSQADVAAMVDALPPDGRRRLTAAMRTVEAVLEGRGDGPRPILLRPNRPGDIGWIIHRHAVLYTGEYGWNAGFETLVAEIAAQFLAKFDPAREMCLIAELGDVLAGSVMVVRDSDEVARLRLLLVEPEARGHGIGRRLVEECVRFARGAGYRKLTLWTNNVLTAARRIYETAGFRLVSEEPHDRFGPPMVGQTWDLDLRP